MKFVPEHYIKGKKGYQLRSFSRQRIVKVMINRHGNERGVISIPSHIYLPKEYIGKRIIIKLEIQEDQK